MCLLADRVTELLSENGCLSKLMSCNRNKLNLPNNSPRHSLTFCSLCHCQHWALCSSREKRNPSVYTEASLQQILIDWGALAGVTVLINAGAMRRSWHSFFHTVTVLSGSRKLAAVWGLTYTHSSEKRSSGERAPAVHSVTRLHRLNQHDDW